MDVCMGLFVELHSTRLESQLLPRLASMTNGEPPWEQDRCNTVVEPRERD